jgi:FkbM family methyltransferase
VLSSAAATIRSREPVLVDFDGTDWRMRWGSDRTLYSDQAWTTPRYLTEQFLPLFFHAYAPRPGDIVVDCGSGIGTEIRVLPDLVGPKGMVIAIEPGPDAYRRLARMVADLPVQNVRVVESAISDWSGRGTFTSAGASEGVEDFLAPATATVGADSVVVDTLASVVTRFGLTRIDYLRMNIEGEELKALAGMGDALDLVAHLCVSCHDFTGRPFARTFDALRSLLIERGFALKSYPDEDPTSLGAFYVFAHRPGG